MNDRRAERHGYIDGLRGFAILSVVLAHVAGPLTVHATAHSPGRGDGSLLADAFLWPPFRMPLFFLVSGFCAALLIRKLGASGFARHRLLRLGLPLALATFILLPLITLMTWRGSTPNQDPALSEILTPDRPRYLWYLLYLLAITAVALAVRPLLSRSAFTQRVRVASVRAAKSGWLAVLLAAPTALFIWAQPGHEFAASLSFVPSAGALAYVGVFFAFGWLLMTEPQLLSAISERPWRKLGIAALLWVPGFVLFLHISGPTADPAGMGLVVAIQTFAVWTLCFSMFGLFRRYAPTDSRAVAYFADFSFWLYLTHYPVLVAAQSSMRGWSGPLAAEFWLTVIAAIVVPLALYQAFVRYTAIGRLLHGPRERPRHRASRQATRPTGLPRAAPRPVSRSAAAAAPRA